MPVYDSKTKKTSSASEDDDELVYEGPDLEDIDLDEAIDTGALPVEDDTEDYGYEEEMSDQRSVQKLKSEAAFRLASQRAADTIRKKTEPADEQGKAVIQNTEQNQAVFAGLSPATWVYTLFLLRIPVVGIFYILIHLASRKTTPVRRSFLKGYLYYKLIMLAVCLVILFIGVQVAAHYVEIALEYMKML